MKIRALKTDASGGFIGLVELMLIIAVIGILAGLSTPAFRQLRQRTKEAIAIQDMGNILRPAIETYRVNVGEYPPTSYTNVTSSPLMTNPYTPATLQYSRWLSGGPYMSGVVTDPWRNPYLIVSWGFTGCVVVSNGRNGTLDTTNITATPSSITATEPDRRSGRFSNPNDDDIGVVIEGF